MIEKQSFSDRLIINALNTYYDIEITSLSFLPWGADMNASIYKAQSHDQTSYFVKLKHGHNHDISVVILELLHNVGIQQVIPPIKTIYNLLTQRIEDSTLIVYPFVKGRDGFTCHLTDNQWINLGKTLRKIHEIDVPSSIQKQIRRENYSPKWREIVRSIYTYIKAEPIVDIWGLKLMKFMKENTLIIHRLVDRAEQLGKKLQQQSHPFVLCHSDIHGGNVLLGENGSLFIVDWDEPIMAPKERDLMFIGGGVGNVWNRPNEEKLFYTGYGKTEVNSTIMAYYRHERIVEDIAVYGKELLLTTAGGEGRQKIYNFFMSMFEPNGVVDIAFTTDEGLLF